MSQDGGKLRPSQLLRFPSGLLLNLLQVVSSGNAIVICLTEFEGPLSVLQELSDETSVKTMS